jgi:hypothetical protein
MALRRIRVHRLAGAGFLLTGLSGASGWLRCFRCSSACFAALRASSARRWITSTPLRTANLVRGRFDSVHAARTEFPRLVHDCQPAR